MALKNTFTFHLISKTNTVFSILALFVLVSCQNTEPREITQELDEVAIAQKSEILPKSDITSISFNINEINHNTTQYNMEQKKTSLAISNKGIISCEQYTNAFNYNYDGQSSSPKEETTVYPNFVLSDQEYKEFITLLTQIDYKNLKRTTSPYSTYYTEEIDENGYSGHYEIDPQTNKRVYLAVDDFLFSCVLTVQTKDGNSYPIDTYEYYANNSNIKQLYAIIEHLLAENFNIVHIKKH